MKLTKHATRNRAQWNTWADDYVASAERNWAPDAKVSWGIWDIPETEAKLFGPAGIERFRGAVAIEWIQRSFRSRRRSRGVRRS